MGEGQACFELLTVAQDGDDKGVFKLGGIPTAGQAATLRKLLGLRRATPLTDDQRATLRRFSFTRDKPPVPEPSVAIPDEAAMCPMRRIF